MNQSEVVIRCWKKAWGHLMTLTATWIWENVCYSYKMSLDSFIYGESVSDMFWECRQTVCNLSNVDRAFVKVKIQHLYVR